VSIHCASGKLAVLDQLNDLGGGVIQNYPGALNRAFTNIQLF
jgi:hypothetical protein